MLIVAPIGKTKLETSFFTPNSFSTLSIVTGRVAALELVEKATNCAGKIPLINSLKFLFRKIFINSK